MAARQVRLELELGLRLKLAVGLVAAPSVSSLNAFRKDCCLQLVVATKASGGKAVRQLPLAQPRRAYE